MDALPETEDTMVFNHYTIRMFIGIIALILPWVVSLRAWFIPYSISWSYHTTSHDIFVGALFVLGAFLMSYKGHQYIIPLEKMGRFWRWLNHYWPSAITFRIWQRQHEEDIIGWIGGIAAWVAALVPTNECHTYACPWKLAATIHIISAFILFSTTIYFCLVAFKYQIELKMNDRKLAPLPGTIDALKLRLTFYWISGLGIIAVMVGLLALDRANIELSAKQTFWAEAIALTFFGLAWFVASRPVFLPVLSAPNEKR